ncbi:phage tail protein [Undibacterium sp. RTI2.1]|uniref:phage tail protein n=1 Tax=unclassified Undibacterium TaxID=2630295 RepID=UPI002AB4251F|nr:MULTISPECIES: phage tail protein [unclassified Undibacterium]MDY7537668.1 phage tail protein [Undibacterium sp. 5I1]MEB0029270.1 phage tail protein [Undibacterium sp. RTI2.1]MEB0115578.1 phage tail protein [Undibacterium sp. RTI2.2]MEB0256405.1 phage tail protein [Undibacterium sp. 5I1]
MAIKIDVKSNIDSVLRDMQRVEADVRQKATVRALNKVIAQVKTDVSRQIRDAGYNLKVSDIKKGLATFNATSGNLTARCVASGRPIPLIRYSARETSKGVSVSVLNGRKVISGAFIATMPSGHKGVYTRTGNAHKKIVKNGRTTWSGLPIKELFGPSIPDGMANKAVQDSLQRLVDDKFPSILAQQIKYLMR